ncbi:MAG: SsrA-binding protein SmpB [Firmicutes bacterium]|nr:SsrA-binding protein SmpB [Bacillota bacterium]HOB35766.1 SsrA-binding protein SmpB [Bacillota bacterium]HPZ91160.1 SsrA-binding protein SmpB [Bacillota bacterium]HQE01505.1 SsrA-binding protein SmpB [Bacillota bacterium]
MAMDEIKVIAENRKARHDYHIQEVMEAGLVLQGTEVKSIRARRVNLKDSFARVENNEVFLHGMHVSPYEQGNRFNHDPLRPRKLLLNRSEIRRLIGITREKGMALIPLRLYLRRGLVKVELAVARGKKLYDKRRDLAERTAAREIERTFRERQKQ